MIQRSITTFPGYDCRKVCIHTPQCEHGIRSDEWIYWVKNMDARCTLALTISTNVYPLTVDPRSLSWMGDRFSGVNLCRHYAHPTTREDVLDGPGECGYIGKCYSASWGLRADEFAKLWFVPEHGREQHTRFWLALESELEAEIKRCEAARIEDGDLKWKVCPCCRGERVVAP